MEAVRRDCTTAVLCPVTDEEIKLKTADVKIKIVLFFFSG